MILTKTFQAPAAVAEWFNQPANALLRLVSVLPETRGLVALYEALPGSTVEIEAERLRLLEERILSLWQLDDDRKVKLGFSRSILDENIVPLSVVSNKLGHLAAFKGLDTRQRAEWIRANLAAVGCSNVPPDDARENYGSAAELIRIEV